MEKKIVSHQDRDPQNNSQHLFRLLSPPHLHPSAPCLVRPLSDQVYSQAAAIFQQLRAEKPVTHELLHYEKKTDTPLPASGDKATQQRAYQLAFNTLKYQDLLENVITDSCFHTSHQICSDLLPLAMVMLFDFQDRKFLPLKQSLQEGQETIQEVRDLDRSLQKWKIKLAASLARYRVKQNLWSVSCYLSDSVRTKQHRAKCLPLYAWINTLKTSVKEVCEALKSDGLGEAENMTNLRDSTFTRDPLCPDTLVFSQHLHTVLQFSQLTNTHVLNIQDRSVCVAVSVLKPLLFDKGDVLVAGFFSAVTLAHIAVVATARSGRVLVCGSDHTPSQVEDMQEMLRQMEIKNVRVLSEAFCSLDEWNAAVQRLKVIIVLPQCSSSALNDPVATMLSEHGDWELLPDLSHGSVSKSKIYSLTTQQARLLAHALAFPKVQTVVYCTRSVYPEENEQLVGRVLEKTHTHTKLLPFRVNGPIFPAEAPSGDTADSKFFWLKPSHLTNGCFIARLSRQADPTKVETVQDVLARAVAKGLLGDINPDPSKTSKKGKSKKNRAASATSQPSSPSSQERLAEAELENGQRPDDSSTNEEDKEEEVLQDKEEKVGEMDDDKGGKKKRRKRMAKRHPKQTKNAATAQKHQSKSHKMKPTKKKENQSQNKRQQMRSKPRRIPRLTLALISSAKPSSQLSPITALAHKISGNQVIKSQQTDFMSPSLVGKHLSTARPVPPASLAASKKQNTQPKGAERTLKDITKPLRQMARPGNVVGTQEEVKAADFVLPPIPPRPTSTPHSNSGVSVPQALSQTSSCQLANMSASSSSIFLPG
ncbi:putative methyltransferase NSUN7 [Melanotaenia boesemani]|uniref:putative methyltransferase NSUN7 n=1 Tax=Melanotaenia boesemani TaxID=1250792 RepID=UPI001C0532BC|nr:putative methyltransferase NSUN7 [Melanotaenia boesemani]